MDFLKGSQTSGTTNTSGNAATSNNTSGGGNGDMLDKGVDFAERKAGHEQSHSTTEKVSDGIRTGFKKVADVPIQDKQYS